MSSRRNGDVELFTEGGGEVVVELTVGGELSVELGLMAICRL